MFVIYNKETTLIQPKRDRRFATERAAKAFLTRMINEAERSHSVAIRAGHTPTPCMTKDEYGIAELAHFVDSIEKKEVRKGIVGAAGQEFTVGVNTSWSSGPWSENYWCQ